jgi:uncharacterized protein YbbC (DUF1343 family)
VAFTGEKFYSEGVKRSIFIFLSIWFFAHAHAEVWTGVDCFFEEEQYAAFASKKIGLIINHTSVDRNRKTTLSLFQEKAPGVVAALFAPEHGIQGQAYAWESIRSGSFDGIVVHSLHGETRRPSSAMLKGLDAVVYDIQCTGVRAYTYPTTLFYMMEEAAKAGIEVIVLDRPNPINGLTVDGPMLDEKWRSFIGYVNVPYCHGMTIGELARFFNEEYKIGCKLRVIPMKGWNRSMSYRETGLVWIPPSPNVPEPDTPLFCPMTGLLGELHIANIGIGYTLPFKIVGAPWIRAKEFAAQLNQQNLPGIHFHPYHFRPFWGLYKGIDCQGVLLQITDSKSYRPLSTQYLLLGMLKSMYPSEFIKRLNSSSRELFSKANGTDAIYEILSQDKYPAWKLIQFQKEERGQFLDKRRKYLLY